MTARGVTSLRGLPRAFPALALLLVALLHTTPLLAAEERILDFFSQIQVHQDGGIMVSETIRVEAQGREIKRGIFRSLPTRYVDDYGNTVRVNYDVHSVLRDGHTEAWHTERQGDDLVIYMGQKDVFLKPGIYAYTLLYRSQHQVGHYQDFDELYWNVTGNAWSFPIEQARCEIVLPPGASALQTAAYTGFRGERGTAFASGRHPDGSMWFETRAPLPPGAGLTVAVSWPKGFVAEPTEAERMERLLRDNRALLAALAGTLLVLLYYLVAWYKVGRDPKAWTIVPLFAPPKGLSPAAARFVMRMGYDNKCFATALISLAVKGFVRIDEDKGLFSKDCTLTRLRQGHAGLSAGERAVMDTLFASKDTFELKQKNHATVQKAIKAHKAKLGKEHESVTFNANSHYMLPGVLLTLLTIGAVALSLEGDERYAALFMTAWLSFWTVACTFLVLNAVTAFRSGNFVAGVLAGLFALPFLGGEIAGIWVYAGLASLPAALCLPFLLTISALFYKLLKAPTFQGRRLMDEIEGFKLFLSVSEKQRLELLHPPERTPELFEKFLPFALALGVENRWSEQFAEVLARAGQEGGYHPAWYSGSSWRSSDPAGFASGLGKSMAGAVTGAARAPGSGGGGSSGGGSSGGGGGGGGGGGW